MDSRIGLARRAYMVPWSEDANTRVKTARVGTRCRTCSIAQSLRAWVLDCGLFRPHPGQNFLFIAPSEEVRENSEIFVDHP